MKIEYVLLAKRSNHAKLNNKKIKLLLTDCFTNVGNNSFAIKLPRSEHIVKYSISYSENQNVESPEKVYCIIFEFDNPRKERAAEILSVAHDLFANNHNLSNYHLILTFDEISEYYCNRAYPTLQHFERRIRQLIFKIMTNAFGALWVDKTILDVEIKNKLKEEISKIYPDMKKNKTLRDEKIVEEALYLMDISSLESFLFEKRRDADPGNLIDFKLSEDILDKMTKEEIIVLLDEGRSKSIWDRFFAKDIPIDKPEAIISTIRTERNKVAHSKPFYKKDYDNISGLLGELIPHIESAIEKVEMIAYEPINVFNVLSGFAKKLEETFTFYTNIGEKITPTLLKLADIGMAASSAIQSQLSKLIVTSKTFTEFLPAPVVHDFPEIKNVIKEIDFHTSSFAKPLEAQQALFIPSVDNMSSLNSNQSAILESVKIPIVTLDSHLSKYPVLNAMQNQLASQNSLLSTSDQTTPTSDVNMSENESNNEEVNKFSEAEEANYE